MQVRLRLMSLISVFCLMRRRKRGPSHGNGRTTPSPTLCETVTEYAIPTAARSSYEEEIKEWIANGWLEPYDGKKMGPAKGLIPLMAIVQQNKDKVRPVMDFRELNSHVDAFTANADVCADKIREWRRLGTNVAIVDLRRAYL